MLCDFGEGVGGEDVQQQQPIVSERRWVRSAKTRFRIITVNFYFFVSKKKKKKKNYIPLVAARFFFLLFLHLFNVIANSAWKIMNEQLAISRDAAHHSENLLYVIQTRLISQLLLRVIRIRKPRRRISPTALHQQRVATQREHRPIVHTLFLFPCDCLSS